jgi:hypothetical protein
MKNLILTAAIPVLFLCMDAKAQADTTHYDLGNVLIKKNFTQSITIKGSDLERYPFNDLTEAIRTFFYGTFTNSASVIYVVDGNIINDVNAYSIYDVEEITLVQNAVAQVSGASPAQQMIVIKTRTHHANKEGITVAGQTSLVNIFNANKVSNTKSTTNFYDQYYVGAYKNFTGVEAGVSADIQHDVYPGLLPGMIHPYSPFNFNRFKLNGYVNANLWKGSTLNVGINYVPQPSNYSATISANYTPTESYRSVESSHILQHLFNSTVSLRSNIVKGLTNTLSGIYNHYNYFENDSTSYSVSDPANPTYSLTRVKGFNMMHTLLIRDNLVYSKQLGDFSIEPALNFSYRKVKDSTYTGQMTTYNNNGNLPGVSSQYSMQYGQYKVYLLTPSMEFAYKDVFNIQAGFDVLLNSNKDFAPAYKLHRAFPFITTSVDIGKWADMSNVSLKIFGSFAKQNGLLDDNYAMLEGFYLQGASSTQSTPVLSNGSYGYIYNYYDFYQLYNNYQAGAELGILKHFTIDYSFEYRYNVVPVVIALPATPNGAQYETAFYNGKTTTNRIGLNYDLHSANFDWKASLNAAESKSRLIDLQSGIPEFYGNIVNHSYSEGHRWTGGFNNRLAYGNLFAGVDVLYQFGERPYSLTNTLVNGNIIVPSNKNSFAIQNLYVGTRFKVENLKYAEVYFNSRNILQNYYSDITDQRRFYGLGFKLDL